MFDIYDKDNNKIEGQLLFTFNKNNKNFIVYSNQEGDILASYFEIKGEQTIISPITDDKEFDLIDEEIEKRLKNDE